MYGFKLGHSETETCRNMLAKRLWFQNYEKIILFKFLWFKNDFDCDFDFEMNGDDRNDLDSSDVNMQIYGIYNVLIPSKSKWSSNSNNSSIILPGNWNNILKIDSVIFI